jgi:hypothetical protein
MKNATGTENNTENIIATNMQAAGGCATVTVYVAARNLGDAVHSALRQDAGQMTKAAALETARSYNTRRTSARRAPRDLKVFAVQVVVSVVTE